MKNSIVLKCLVLLVLVNGFAFSKDAFELKNTNKTNKTKHFKTILFLKCLVLNFYKLILLFSFYSY